MENKLSGFILDDLINFIGFMFLDLLFNNLMGDILLGFENMKSL